MAFGLSLGQVWVLRLKDLVDFAGECRWRLAEAVVAGSSLSMTWRWMWVSGSAGRSPAWMGICTRMPPRIDAGQ
jgi:hypothetical protein